MNKNLKYTLVIGIIFIALFSIRGLPAQQQVSIKPKFTVILFTGPMSTKVWQTNKYVEYGHGIKFTDNNGKEVFINGFFIVQEN